MRAEVLFSGYLTLRRFTGAGGPIEVLSGPGHDVVVVTCWMRTPAGVRFAVKRGDTRPARVLRGRPYVLRGLVAGRLDHPGHAAAAVGRAEVEEEIGGRVRGEVETLGPVPVPTMPVASTEADLHVLAEVELAPDAQPSGDGGGMEVPELLGHDLMTPAEVLRQIRAGELGEACRARVAFGRAIERLGVAVGAAGGEAPPLRGRPRGSADIDGARVEVRRAIPLETLPGRFLDAEARHLSGDRAVGAPFAAQILELEVDEIEVLPCARDERGEVWVGLQRAHPPALAVKRELGSEVRSERGTPVALWAGATARVPPGEADAAARRLSAARGWGEPSSLLGSEASPGQSTFAERVYAAPARLDEARMTRLPEALARVRAEGGSARTEAGLLELADRAPA